MVAQLLFVCNDPIAPEGLLGDVFADRGFDIDTHNVTAETVFPDPARYDVVVLLGARASVYDDGLRQTWVGSEMQLVHDAMAAGVGVLGVCFGGQLIAQALGGEVTRSPEPELGWSRIDSDAPYLTDGPWFEWHFDRWTTPPGAHEIARTAHAPQAFVAGTAMAVQFHPEVNSRVLEQWLTDDGDAVTRLRLNPDQLRAGTVAQQATAPARLGTLVDGFLETIAAVR